jgi:hypothetical protein
VIDNRFDNLTYDEAVVSYQSLSEKLRHIWELRQRIEELDRELLRALSFKLVGRLIAALPFPARCFAYDKRPSNWTYITVENDPAIFWLEVRTTGGKELRLTLRRSGRFFLGDGLLPATNSDVLELFDRKPGKPRKWVCNLCGAVVQPIEGMRLLECSNCSQRFEKQENELVPWEGRRV